MWLRSFSIPRATIQKACALIAEAAAAGARLIAFPESFVPGFPIWAAVQAPIKSHEYFKLLAANSIEVPGPEVRRLCETARDNGIFVSIGISERTQVSVGFLWNSNLLIGNEGTVLNHHRKLVPTFYEKLIWANASATTQSRILPRCGDAREMPAAGGFSRARFDSLGLRKEQMAIFEPQSPQRKFPFLAPKSCDEKDFASWLSSRSTRLAVWAGPDRANCSDHSAGASR